MIAFATRPGPVFSAFFELAIENCLDYCQDMELNLRDGLNHDEDWVSVYPLLSSHFTPTSAISILTDLQMLWKAKATYMPTEFHWLVMYEALKHLSEDINDGAGWFSEPGRLVGPYRLDEINFSFMIDVFFHDTDFRMGQGFCGLVEDLPPLSGELSVEKLPDSYWDGQSSESDDLYKPGAPYPYAGEDDEEVAQ